MPRWTSRQRLRRQLDRLQKLQPVDDGVAATRIVMAVELSRTLIALDAAESATINATLNPPPVTQVFLCDGYADQPVGRRAELEAQIAAARIKLWSEPERREEILGEIAAL